MRIVKPKYLELSKEIFEEKIRKAKKLLSKCSLCPRECYKNRFSGETGFCKAGAELEVAHWQLHFGEEPALANYGGAGTIFFARCNLKCVYCQNYQISQEPEVKKTLSSEALSRIMLDLQKDGAQNIDLVSPTHFVPRIIEAVYLAREKGFFLPLVYNTNGYESLSTLEILSGIVDIYLPDIKYADDKIALRYSQAADYVEVTQKAVTAMYKQVGDLVIDKNGCAQRGVIVRHLVLPNKLAGSIAVLDFIKKTLGVNIGLSLMNQYAPCYLSGQFDELNRKLTDAEYKEVVDYAEKLGFENCWIQEPDSSAIYFPDFEKQTVFKNGHG